MYGTLHFMSNFAMNLKLLIKYDVYINKNERHLLKCGTKANQQTHNRSGSSKGERKGQKEHLRKQ
jgi:hypothetical protein